MKAWVRSMIAFGLFYWGIHLHPGSDSLTISMKEWKRRPTTSRDLPGRCPLALIVFLHVTSGIAGQLRTGDRIRLGACNMRTFAQSASKSSGPTF